MDVEEYTPDLPTEDWLRVRLVVLETVREVAALLPYPQSAVMNAVAHHVDWCVNVAGYPLEQKTLFRRDIVAYAVDNMPTSSPSTRGRRRSLMLRVGEQLGVIETPLPLPPLQAAQPSRPYSAAEVFELCAWAEYQNSAERRCSALALLALGLGAGLPTRDLCSVRACDVSDSGTTVDVGGKRPRTVSVGDDWAPVLAELAADSPQTTARLFRPGAGWHSNIVTVFIDRTCDTSVRPTTQRMRTTWIVERLATGTPMHLLLHMAGVSSMDALVRYEKFLPPVAPRRNPTP